MWMASPATDIPAECSETRRDVIPVSRLRPAINSAYSSIYPIPIKHRASTRSRARQFQLLAASMQTRKVRVSLAC